jgi:DNA-nicking Smr family endonuclease
MNSSSRKPPDSDDDFQAFAEAMRQVARRPEPNRATPDRKPPSSRAAQLEADERAVLKELLEHDPEHWIESGEDLAYRAPGLQDAAFRRLRRGSYRIESELDLHGMNSERARIELHRFLAESIQQGRRCVRVIHGKGLRSSNKGPVLKTRVDRWLRRTKVVLAFCSARPQDGGSGAVYVLLRAG